MGYTTVFCVAIGLLLWFLDVAEPLTSALTVSLCIGWSINLTFIAVGDSTERLLPPYIASILLTAVGLGVGLFAAGTALFRDPLFFYADNYGSLVLGVFFAIVGISIFGTRDRLIAARAELAVAESQRQTQDKLLLETELRLLQAQIEPHFLFNTLSNVVGLIHKDPTAAEQTLLNLTTLLRSSLQRTRAQSVTLAEELIIVQAYLEIQSIRMQGRLRYEVLPAELLESTNPHQGELGAWSLPPLLVQPIVENAVKHGIDPAEEGGQIEVKAGVEGERLVITVSDTGVGIVANGAGGKAGSGTGLSNVRHRLQALYGELASMTITENRPSGVVVRLSIPGARE
jgi:signal transduction histidine kinase